MRAAAAAVLAQGTKHREGAWRAWRLSGALLEFSAWSSRQSPCLRHHLSISARTEQDALAQLQQQLHVRRKARQAALDEERRRRKRSRGQDSNSDDDADAAAGYDYDQRPGSYSVELSWDNGAQLWGFVLLFVAAWLLACEEHRLLLVAPVAAAGAVVYCIGSGVLLPNEAAVQQLARIFDQDGFTPHLVSVAVLWAVGCCFFCAGQPDTASTAPRLLWRQTSWVS
jgi:Flp pilus assembly protein TadB